MAGRREGSAVRSAGVMPGKRSKWTVSVAPDQSRAGKGWVATIKELPEFRAVAASQGKAVQLLMDHLRMIDKLGPNPIPEVVAFWKDQSIRNWIACRRVDVIPHYSRFGGFEWIPAVESVLSKYGITQEDYIGILDIDEHKIKIVCLKILEHMARSTELANEGKTHLVRRFNVMPPETIDWLICCMIDAFDWHGEPEWPIDLIMLIRFRLIPSMSKIEQHGRMMRNRRRAEWIGGSLTAQGKAATFRSVALQMGVQPSTVKRWFKSLDEFQTTARRLAECFQPDGQLKPLSQHRPGALHQK